MPGGIKKVLPIQRETVERLRDEGRTRDEIAATFGVTPVQLENWCYSHMKLTRAEVRQWGIGGTAPTAAAPTALAQVEALSRAKWDHLPAGDTQESYAPIARAVAEAAANVRREDAARRAAMDAPAGASPFRHRNREGGIAIAIVIEGARVIVPPFEVEGEITDVEVAIAAAEIRRRLDELLGDGAA